LQKLRRAMVAPEREPLTGAVEVDETLVGGRREGRHVARRHGEKALVGVIVEVRCRGSGRLRLEVLPNASADTLTAWVGALVAPGAIVHTDGWKGYRGLAGAGYEHRPRLQRRDHPDAQKLLPRAHRAASNLKPGYRAPIAASHPITCRSISTSSSPATTAAACQWPRFRPCSGLGALHEPTTYREITRRESAAA
jgi:hypothetical protein